MNTKLKASLAVALAMLIYSSQGILIRYTAQSTFLITFFASLFSATILLAVLIKKRLLNRNIFHKEGIYLLLIGIAGLITNVSFFYAYQKTSISNAVFLHYIAPLIVVILSLLLFKESITGRKIATLTLSLTGIFLISRIYSGSFQLNIGDLAAILSACAYAATLLLYKKALEKYPFEVTIFFQMIITVLFLLPSFLMNPMQIAPREWLILLFLGVIAQCFSVVLHVGAIKTLQVSTVAVLGYLEPVFAIILGILIFSEIPLLTTVVGGGLILLSSYLAIEK